MGAGAPTQNCKSCDTPIRPDNGRCPQCGAVLADVADDWNELRITQDELHSAPPPSMRARSRDWGRAEATQLSGKRTESRTAEERDGEERISEGRAGELPNGASLAPPLPSHPAIPPPVAIHPSIAPIPSQAPVQPVPVSAPPIADPDSDDTLDDDEPFSCTIRPPVLASDSLQRELFPTEPGRVLIRWIASGLGLAGVSGTLFLLGLSPGGVPICSGFAALTALGIVPMAYLARAAALVLFATLGIFASNLIHYGGAHDGRALGLLASVTLLGLGLHFRAWHRASKLARALVAFGIIASIAWLSAMGSLNQLSVLDADWRSWGPRVLELPLGILLTLSLLAFMDARTTAGCGVWAAALWCWYGAYLGLFVLAKTWPPGTPLLYAMGRAGTGALIQLANALLAPLLALASAQLMAGAVAVVKTNQRSLPPLPQQDNATVLDS